MAGSHCKVWLLLLLIWPTVAWAQAGVDQARIWFAEAQALEESGDYAAAAAKLESAIAVKETPGLRFHLAFCQEKLGRWVEALSSYDRARALLAAGAQAEDVASRIELARADLLRRLPAISIEVTRAPAGLRARIEDRDLAPADLGGPILVNPGTYRVRLSAPGHVPVERTVTVRAEERPVLRVELVADPPPVASDPPPKPRRGLPLRSVVLVTEASLGAIALSIGVGYTLKRSAAADSAEAARADIDRRSASGSSACTAPTASLAMYCADLEEANETGAEASQVATIAWVGAGVAAAALVTTWALWQPEESTGEIRIGAAPLADGAIATLAARF